MSPAAAEMNPPAAEMSQMGDSHRFFRASGDGGGGQDQSAGEDALSG